LQLIVLFKEVGISGLFDIAFMTVLVYTMIVFFKRTKAASVLTGILIIGIVYLLSRQFNMFLTASLFQQFFAVILIVVVVIFQEELRRFFEQVAVWSFRDRHLGKRKLMRIARKEVEMIVRAVTDLAREQIGALVVIQGRDPIIRHLEGGIDLNGELSEILLKSIFDKHSPGHDGAVVIEQGKLSQFGCQLPLSKDFQRLQRTGTRHAAALGLAELTDALCVVVSEERKTISVAKNGEIERVSDPEKLSLILERHYREIAPPAEARPWYDYFRKNSLEKIVALIMSIVLWFVLVHESRIVSKTFTIPVLHTETPSEFHVKSVQPQDVKVTLSGPRRTFYFFNKEEVKLFLQLFNTFEGLNYVNASRSDLIYPSELSFVNLNPSQFRVTTESNKKKEEKK